MEIPATGFRADLLRALPFDDVRHVLCRVAELNEPETIDTIVDLWAVREGSISFQRAAERLLDEMHSAPGGQQEVRVRALAMVVVPAAKAWSTGHGADVVRGAVGLARMCGISEQTRTLIPNLAGRPVSDAARVVEEEGRLVESMRDEVFLAQAAEWVRDLRAIASRRPGTGACTIASATELWLWTLSHVGQRVAAGAGPEPTSERAMAPLADALCWLLASRAQILDVERLAEDAGAGTVDVAVLAFLTDLCHVQAARAAGEVGRICAQVVFGGRRHPGWDAEGCAACYRADELDGLEDLFPGMASAARGSADVIEEDGSHRLKAGPCARFDGLDTFTRLRIKLDGCLTGSGLARDRAAQAVAPAASPDTAAGAGV